MEKLTCFILGVFTIISVSDGIARFKQVPNFYCGAYMEEGKIPDFVPCLEENRADYMLLMECQQTVMVMMNTWVSSTDLTPDDLFDLSINFLNVVNDIVCSRTDEFYDLVECVNKHYRAFQPNYQRCIMENLSPIMTFMQAPHENPQESHDSVLCGSLYGFGSCVRDTMAGFCEDSTDLLDTFFDDVVIGVVVDGLGCEPHSNPLLSLVRSVRNKLRR